MYITYCNQIIDFDIRFLMELLDFLDRKLDYIQELIDESFDPDQMGLLDDAEYVIGMGLIGCQRYMTSIYGPRSIPKQDALSIGPYHTGNESIARIIHAAANYWKHGDEWVSTLPKSKQQQNTIRIIESVTPIDSYTCVTLLHEITQSQAPRLRSLVPLLKDWRDNLHAKYVA